MLFYIGMYYLIGIVATVIGGIYLGIYTTIKGLTNDESKCVIERNIHKVGLSTMLPNCSRFGRGVLHIISWIIMPILGVYLVGSILIDADRLIESKKAEP